MNAQKELLDHVGDREVELVKVVYHNGYPLKIEGTLEEVLPLLDFDYNNGHGWQVLYGHIWYTDGTWSDREEYDGSEWWEYRCPPDKTIDVMNNA